ncbi:PD-(D/E)XK nuclease family protein [Aquibacillus saliphilus]|uniref:PD-(D/E)XK nuclease family protein n=1 Tax=Aquibacillus saliphilus TaxID=1909422 RepID=UPI001CF0BB9B
MKALVEQLREINQEYKYNEKVLLVDSYPIGHQITQAYVSEGFHAINLKIKTVRDLANEIVELNCDDNHQLVDHAVGVHFIYNILNQLNKGDKLTYFNGIEVTPSFSASIHQTISHMRLAGYASNTLAHQAFISSEKANDLVQIMSEYDAVLKANLFNDEAMILEKAISFTHKKSDTIYILQSNLSLTQLDHQLLDRIVPTNSFKLSLPRILGIPTPAHDDLRSIKWSEPTPFSYLYQPDDCSNQPAISLYTAKTEEVELKHIFEQIKQSEAYLDQNVIYYTKSEPYVTTTFQLAEKYQIPITYGDGISISFSRPGKLVSGLIKWMKDQYSVVTFIAMMNEELIDLQEGAPAKTRITKLLRDAKVGWDQSRYSSQLKIAIEKYKRNVTEANTDDQRNYYQKQVNDVTWLYEWFSKLFKKLPVAEREINYRVLLKSIVNVLENHCKTNSVLDRLARAEMINRINLILPFADERLYIYDAFEKVNDLILSIRVNKSGPIPGHLHVTSYQKGLYNNRAHVAIVGLDNRSFPGTPSEDPLLLDEERRKLSSYLPLLQETGKENLYTMLQLLANNNLPVSFSYCSFNISDNRSVSASHLFLQGYRTEKDQPNAEFKELKTLPAPLTPVDIFEEKDYWNSILEKGSKHQLDTGILHKYQNLIHGQRAKKARLEDHFTAYDGQVTIDASIYDPRQNKDRLMTAGKLERLASCPYAFFLQDILKLKPVEETTYDPYAWLDAATRGSLLHSIFEEFYKGLVNASEKPSYSLHKSKMIEIAKEKLDQQKAVEMPPSQRVFEREVDDIYQCCHIFLKEEEEYAKNYQAQHFEYAFGINDIAPAVVTLPSNQKINVAGKIDRVDQSSKGHFHIIDYKTGSTYNYHESEKFKGGRQLQHFIYALAIEEHLKLESGSVAASSYFFPSSKGLGGRYVRKQDESLRANGLDILEKLVDVVKHGHFTMTDDVNDCTFCDFKSVCRREFYQPETLSSKQVDHEKEGVRKFMGVRAYE